MMMDRKPPKGKSVAPAIGTVVGYDAPEPLFEPGASRWIALRVLPQKEAAAQEWLKRRGVYAFHPVLERRVRRFGKIRTYYRRYLPGLVFARFPGDPVAHLVLASPFVVDALRDAWGRFGVLDAGQIRKLHAMRQIDQADRDKEGLDRRKRVATRMRPGERALFRAGPFAGQFCDVVSVTGDGGLIVQLRLFSGVISGRVDGNDLVSVSQDRDSMAKKGVAPKNE